MGDRDDDPETSLKMNTDGPGPFIHGEVVDTQVAAGGDELNSTVSTHSRGS